MKLGEMTLKQIKEIKDHCEDYLLCDNCPLYILKVFDCIETKCKLMIYNLDQEIEVEEDE